MSFLDPINQLPADFRFTSSNPNLLEQMEEETAAALKTCEALWQERGLNLKNKIVLVGYPPPNMKPRAIRAARVRVRVSVRVTLIN